MSRIITNVEEYAELQIELILKSTDPKIAVESILRYHSAVLKNAKASKHSVMLAEALIARLNKIK